MRRRILWTAALLISVAMILIGIFDDEVSIVFHKAATICLECIGIG